MIKGMISLENDNIIRYGYSICDGMCLKTTWVNKDWFDAHNSDDITPEEMDKLAYSKEERELSGARGQSSWWGLG